MNTNDLTQQIIERAKNLKKFVVQRDFDQIPLGIVKFDVQHSQGELARIFVYALNQEEAEQIVDEWFSDDTPA
jgi:hypothetical protein